MNIFFELEKLVNEHGSAVILKERIAFAREQNETLEEKIKTLEKEIVALLTVAKTKDDKIEMLESSLRAFTEEERFKKFKGLLWRYDENGGIDPKAFCPKCKLGMITYPRDGRASIYWICLNCDVKVEWFTAPTS